MLARKIIIPNAALRLAYILRHCIITWAIKNLEYNKGVSAGFIIFFFFFYSAWVWDPSFHSKTCHFVTKCGEYVFKWNLKDVSKNTKNKK